MGRVCAIEAVPAIKEVRSGTKLLEDILLGRKQGRLGEGWRQCKQREHLKD